MHCLNSDNYPVFKVVLIGDSGVGKTCLLSRFCERGFPNDTCVTVGVEFGSRYIFLNGRKIQLQLWDTAGMERYRKTMPQLYYRNANAILFVYDMTNLTSFKNIKYWIHECHLYQTNPHVLQLLIGNKCDCVAKVAVSTAMAHQFAQQHNLKLYETSAKDDKEHRSMEIMLFELAQELDSKQQSDEDSRIYFVPGFREPIIIKHRTYSLQRFDESSSISESDPYCHCP